MIDSFWDFFLWLIKSSLRNTGYSSNASMEIIDAITVLMSYGLITKIPPTQILGQNLSNLGGFNNSSGGINPNAANLLQILSSSLSKVSNINYSLILDWLNFFPSNAYFFVVAANFSLNYREKRSSRQYFIRFNFFF